MTSYSTTASEVRGSRDDRAEGSRGGGAGGGVRSRSDLVLHSLRRGGRELLAVNDGLGAYRDLGATMGVPLLYPWANRLSGSEFAVAGTGVELPRDASLSIAITTACRSTGRCPGSWGWVVVEASADEDRACLRAQLEWEPAHKAFRMFPFSHRLGYEAVLMEASIEITVTRTPAGERSVPVSFGFHPYLRIPGGERANARMTLPVRRRLIHDGSMIPARGE